MCGISGIISTTKIKLDSLVKMNQIIKHRGPDDEGFALFNTNGFETLSSGDTATESLASNERYAPQVHVSSSSFEGNIGFGHRRLSILDLSPKGHQPMCSDDERYWITFNGEIYNYLEIREELKACGYVFHTDADTEVVLTAYAHWGINCQNRFNGMWAFVIYDRKEQRIFLSRDRFGIKPLYYWFSPEGDFYFASEIKQFTKLPGWKSILNKERALDYLYYSVMDHTDETLFKGVYALLPGNCFVESISQIHTYLGGKLPLKKWYVPDNKSFEGSFEAAKDVFLAKFKDAVKLHLRSDVPVGSALSGGLDSSSIVCYVNKLLKEQNKSELQKTFSSCATDERFDERVWMDEVVKASKVEAHFIYPKGEDVFTRTKSVLWHLDEPYESQSAFLANHIFEEARKNKVIVLLNGLGADEYLSGYGSYKKLRLKKLLLQGRLSSLYREMKSDNLLFSIPQEIIFDILPNYFKSWIYTFKKGKYFTNGIFTNKWKDQKPIHPYLLNKFEQNSIRNISNYKIFHNPLQRYLKWEDRNSMAHSVEARVPFLDHRLVEFTQSLPVEYLDGMGKSKKILVEAIKGILPETVRMRKDKKGFISPMERWFKEDYFEDFIVLFKENVKFTQGLINENEAICYFNKVKKGKHYEVNDCWRLILFCIWMRIYDVEI
jgi:asparagine synthase (glutamine-hydrolysing)